MEMSDISVRRGISSDAPALKALWCSVFGDSDAFVDTFMETFFDSSVCVLVEVGESLAAMGFLLPVGFLRSPYRDDIPCGMIYAVATKPSMRGKGYGEAVTRGLLDAASEEGSDAVVLCPAEESLFDYYSQRVGLESVFCCTEERISIAPLSAVPLRRVTAAEYIVIREKILKDTPHITFDERCFEYQERIGDDGGLFTADCGEGETCCAAVEVCNGAVRIVELLGDGEKLLHAIVQKFTAENYFVRRPGQDKRFGMVNAGISVQNAWFGLAFD